MTTSPNFDHSIPHTCGDDYAFSDDCPGCQEDDRLSRLAAEKQREAAKAGYHPGIQEVLTQIYNAYMNGWKDAGGGPLPQVDLKVSRKIFENFEESLISMQRFVEAESTQAGFKSLAFRASRMTIDPNVRDEHSIKIVVRRPVDPEAE